MSLIKTITLKDSDNSITYDIGVNANNVTYNNLNLKNYLEELDQERQKVHLDDVYCINSETTATNTILTWFDSDNEEWAGTQVRKGINQVPRDINDGILITDSTIKNQYSDEGFVDNNISVGNVYYYRFFPYIDENNYTIGSVIKVIPKKKPGNITLDTSLISLINKDSETVTLSNVTGNLTYIISDNNIIDVALDNDKLVITGKQNGNAQIILNVAETAEYSSTQVIINVIVAFPNTIIIFDDENATTKGTLVTTAQYLNELSNIEIPQKEYYTFRGYYTEKNGLGIKYYNENGIPQKDCDVLNNLTLYAYWVS